MPQINAPTPDATNAIKGKVQLAGDLTGTAAAPTLAPTAIRQAYAEITTDFQTTSTSDVQVTGLTATITVPSGGRSVKISFFTKALYTASSTGNTFASIWDGTVGTGTKLQEIQAFQNGGQVGVTMFVVKTPAAGSKTYNIGLRSLSANSATITAATTSPACLLVELI